MKSKKRKRSTHTKTAILTLGLTVNKQTKNDDESVYAQHIFTFTKTGNTVLIIKITHNMPIDFIQNNKSIMNSGDETLKISLIKIKHISKW